MLGRSSTYLLKILNGPKLNVLSKLGQVQNEEF